MSAARVLRIDCIEAPADDQSTERTFAQFRIGVVRVGCRVISRWQFCDFDAQRTPAWRDSDNGAGWRAPVTADGERLGIGVRCRYRER